MADRPSLGLIICGDRCAQDSDWGAAINNALIKYRKHYDIQIIYHGDCRGIDRISGAVGKRLSIPVVPVPADWNLGMKAGPMRNKLMLEKLMESKVDCKEVVAFHPNIDSSKGTKHMANLALGAGIKVSVYTRPYELV